MNEKNNNLVRVRFAPSPTGQLHIGGARTALYNYFFAKYSQGKFILRIEDTDEDRSKREYEKAQINDLLWLGINYDEGPGKEGDYGPYRQSERKAIYQKHAQKLIDEKKAYYCFCTEEVLAEKKDKAKKEGRPPHYDGTCKNLNEEECISRLAAGENAVVRFNVIQKPYILHDECRGKIVFPKDMVGDFVIQRSSGMPVYNFCCVVDDYLMKITHVIRGEDHLSNTLRQLMIYEAMDAVIPSFTHLSLLVGEDRQKLSKRHGATSLVFYKENHYLPQAIANYLTLLGWSHPNEIDVFSMDEVSSVFTLDRFSKSPALFDLKKFQFINGQHLRNLNKEDFFQGAINVFPKDHNIFQYSLKWRERVIEVFKHQINFYQDFIPLVDDLFSLNKGEGAEYLEIMSLESAKKIKSYLLLEIKNKKLKELEFVSIEDFDLWTDHIKKNLNIKGKELFKGIRAVLTGKAEGAELKYIIPLTPLDILLKRCED